MTYGFDLADGTEARSPERLACKALSDFGQLCFGRGCEATTESHMVWTETTHRNYLRDGLRYASGTTGPGWAVLKPLLPPAQRLGRPGAGTRTRSSMRSAMFSPPVASGMRRRFSKLRHIFADRVHGGPQLRAAIDHCGPRAIEIVERPAGVKGFQLLPWRWVMERTIAWLGWSRRLAKGLGHRPIKGIPYLEAI